MFFAPPPPSNNDMPLYELPAGNNKHPNFEWGGVVGGGGRVAFFVPLFAIHF